LEPRTEIWLYFKSGNLLEWGPPVGHLLSLAVAHMSGISPSGIKLRYAARLQFNSEADKCTNNIAEYEAIVLVLHKLRAIGV
jgi:hypothetical protein